MGIDRAVASVPPVVDVVDFLLSTFAGSLVCAIQVFETTDSTSLRALSAQFSRSRLKVYAFNAPGQNHGILLGSRD